MEIIQALILGIIQGITEWLPISSSGHLVIVQHFFKIDQPLAFDVMLHLGSLLVILAIYRKDIVELIKGFFNKEKSKQKIVFYLIIATIPAAIAGLLLNNYIEKAFSSIKIVGITLIITAILVFISKYPKKKENKLTLKNTIIIGLFQAAALLPGLSRSGSTISSALFQGIKRKEAVKFSFLLAIPALAGAGLLKAKEIMAISDPIPVTVGIIASILFGYFTLKFLINLVKKEKFHYFSWYCLLLGLITLYFAYF
jgi:undecaprenyl-diphosphatase